MPIEKLLALVGATAALLLIVGLLLGIAAGTQNSKWRIWPAPPVGSLTSFLFWTLFRTMNVAVLVLAVDRFLTAHPDEHTPLHLALAAISFLAGIAYFYTLWFLGRRATYCQASGLATGGVYRWSRNPQYATAIVAFTSLGLAASAWDATSLGVAVAIVYALMARAEEPWLAARYGREYDDYRAEVPRFFNARHAVAEATMLLRRRLPLSAGNQRQRR